MAADMVGYSRLMAADESGTIMRHKSYRQELIDPKIAGHDGRVVKATGDGFLVEFSSVVDAVQCAVEIQGAIAEHETNTPAERRIQYRIGINLGDVVDDEGDIFGDSVNVAARLEQLADAGGVCVSDFVYQNVKSKLDLHFENLGPKAVKNIPEAIQVYSVRTSDAVSQAKLIAPAEKPKLPSRPSIAVLPFTNMSSDREQEFFADGMTEDLITALSRIRELFVISRNSSFIYKGRAVRLGDVARELGVRFILEGSIRVAGKRVRVTAQLIDGLSGDHVWAENFDGGLDDIFNVQDGITRSIALALQVKLTYGEFARLWEGQTQNLRAWEKMVLARDLFLRFNVIDNREARRILQEALKIDPDYTGAMVQLGLTYWYQARFDISVDKQHFLRLAEEQVEKVLSLNSEMGSAYMLRGIIAFLRDQHDQAMELCQKGVDLAPGDSWAQATFGLVCIYAGEADRAVTALKTAMRLSPYYPTWYTYQFALANLWIGDFATAQATAEAYIHQEPDQPLAYTNLAMVYDFQQRDDDAARVISELKERFPLFSIEEVILSQRYKEREKLDRIVGMLRRAGLQN